MKLNSNDILLFSGDSITHGNRGYCMDCNHIMGHGYQYIVAAKLALDNAENMPKFINKGYSGYTMSRLLEKWQEDVIDNKPTILSLLDGTNDVHDGWVQHRTKQEIAEKYFNELNRAIDITKEQLPNIKIIICEPFYYPIDRTHLDYRYTPHPDCEKHFNRPDSDNTDEECQFRSEATELVQKAAREIAKEKADVFVPFNDRFKSEFKKARREYFIWDGTHPTIAGHAIMAEEWFKAVDILK